MKEFFYRLQVREKRLIQIAFVLLIAALIVQTGLIPLARASETARADRARAESTVARLQRLSASGVTQATLPGITPEDPSEIAAQLGLPLAEASVTPQGALLFRFDGAEPGVVFSWMDRVEAGRNLRLVSVQMVSAGGGWVNVTAQYAGGNPP